MRGFRQLPVVLLLVLTVGVPIAIAADPSPSIVPSASAEASAPLETPTSGQPSPAAELSAAPTPTATSVPAPAATPGPSAKPDKSPKPDKANREASKGPEVAITIDGVVGQTTTGKGWKAYTLAVGSKTYELSAGPPWFWGDRNPLAAYVGKSVQVRGTMRQGSTEIDVDSVNGKVLREPGRPPWAGGPWVVGQRHPGWKSWKVDGTRGHGRDKVKDKSAKPGDESPAPS